MWPFWQTGHVFEGFASEFLVSVAVVLLGVGVWLRCWWSRHFEQLAAASELILTAAIAEKAVISDPLESLRQNVDQESTDKLVGSEGHDLVPIVVAIILPTELDFIIVVSEEPIVGDGNAMGITGDVV